MPKYPLSIGRKLIEKQVGEGHWVLNCPCCVADPARKGLRELQSVLLSTFYPLDFMRSYFSRVTLS